MSGEYFYLLGAKFLISLKKNPYKAIRQPYIFNGLPRNVLINDSY